MKTSRKILILNFIYVGILVSLTAGIILAGKKTMDLFGELYKNQFIPLDQLRKIQLLYREIEYRMVGTSMNIVAPIGSGEHLKISLKEINELWEKASGLLTNQIFNKKKNQFNNAHKNFIKLSGKFINAYYNENINRIKKLYNEWLDIKPGLFKSIDSIILKQGQELSGYYLETVESTKTKIIVLIILLIVVIIILVPTVLMIIPY